MFDSKDQLTRQVNLYDPPKRILSLVPSLTELLFDLNLGGRIIGRTKFCIHPRDKIKSLPVIGGTKNLNLEKIRQLSPSLIIANKEENDKKQIKELEQEFPIWISNISNLKQNYEAIQEIGRITGTYQKAIDIIKKSKENFKFLAETLNQQTSKKTVYLIWKNPIMAVGHNTFINAMLEQCKLENIIQSDRYPIISEEKLITLNPEVLLLSTEPFPFKKNHMSYFKNILPNTNIQLVNGEFFSWYGSRLIKSPEYFINLHTLLKV